MEIRRNGMSSKIVFKMDILMLTFDEKDKKKKKNNNKGMGSGTFFSFKIVLSAKTPLGFQDSGVDNEEQTATNVHQANRGQIH